MNELITPRTDRASNRLNKEGLERLCRELEKETRRLKNKVNWHDRTFSNSLIIKTEDYEKLYDIIHTLSGETISFCQHCTSIQLRKLGMVQAKKPLGIRKPHKKA